MRGRWLGLAAPLLLLMAHPAEGKESIRLRCTYTQKTSADTGRHVILTIGDGLIVYAEYGAALEDVTLFLTSETDSRTIRGKFVSENGGVQKVEIDRTSWHVVHGVELRHPEITWSYTSLDCQPMKSIL